MGRTEILEHRAPEGNAISGAPSGLRHGIGWLPLIILPLLAIPFHGRSRPWVFLWLLAAGIFAGCKWQRWWEARMAGTVVPDRKRNAAYLLLWPGMETRESFVWDIRCGQLCESGIVARVESTAPFGG